MNRCPSYCRIAGYRYDCQRPQSPSGRQPHERHEYSAALRSGGEIVIRWSEKIERERIDEAALSVGAS